MHGEKEVMINSWSCLTGIITTFTIGYVFNLDVSETYLILIDLDAAYK